MPTMFPESLSKPIQEHLRGETKVFEAYKSQLSKDWVVYHGVNWHIPSDKYHAQRDGETDFVLTHPELGVLVMEVKGGTQIVYNPQNESWRSIDDASDSHNIRDPFEQARKNRYILIDELLKLREFSQFNKENLLESLNVGYGVIFPDADRIVGNMLPEAHQNIYFTSHNLHSLDKEMKKLATYYAQGKACSPALASAAHNALKARLAPTFHIERSLALWINDEEQRVIELTDAQYELLGFIRDIKRASIYGCAGSGKTLLAIRKAEMLAEANQHTLVVCFNNILGQHFKRHFKDNPYVAAGNFHLIMAHLLGLQEPILDDNKLMELILDHEQGKFDAILVDEAQDFSKEQFEILKYLLKEDGLLYYFWDDSQRINKREVSIPIEPGMFQYTLDTNLRNTSKIFESVQKHFNKKIPLKHKGPLGREIEILEQYNPNDQHDLYQKLRKVINRLISVEGIKPSDITVLTFKAKNKSALSEFTCNHPVHHFTDEPTVDGIRIETVRRFKGMESKVVIVTERDDENCQKDQTLFDDMCYVSFSRAKNHLVIL